MLPITTDNYNIAQPIPKANSGFLLSCDIYEFYVINNPDEENPLTADATIVIIQTKIAFPSNPHIYIPHVKNKRYPNECKKNE